MLRPHGLPQPILSCLPDAGPTAKLEHVTERFAGLWTDLEQEKQVGRCTILAHVLSRKLNERACPNAWNPSPALIHALMPFDLQNRKQAESTKLQLFNEAVQRLEKGLEVGAHGTAPCSCMLHHACAHGRYGPAASCMARSLAGLCAWNGAQQLHAAPWLHGCTHK